jgi:hypothetical protein
VVAGRRGSRRHTCGPGTVRRLHQIADHGGLTPDELAEIENISETAGDQGEKSRTDGNAPSSGDG